MHGKRGLGRLRDAMGYSAAGFATAWRTEEAFRQEVVAGCVLLPAAFWLGQNAIECILLAGSWLLVMIVELLNTAVEATVDRIGRDRHQLSGNAKDLGSAAVFVALLLAGLCWGLIGWQRFAG
jgi:diacylglycerol kinase (ATP)